MGHLQHLGWGNIRGEFWPGPAYEPCWGMAGGAVIAIKREKIFLIHFRTAGMKKKKNPQDNRLNTKKCNYLLFIHIPFSKRKIICCWAWYPLKHWKINQSNKWGTLEFCSRCQGHAIGIAYEFRTIFSKIYCIKNILKWPEAIQYNKNKCRWRH